MGFSKKIKLEVKKKAMFQCCRCHEINVDVHHIDWQREEGPDTFDNAAPLCPNCHRWFGDNPSKKTEIRAMRDNWYETVEKMYGSQSLAILPQIEKINKYFEEFQIEQSKNKKDLAEVKELLRDVSNKAIDNMTFGTASIVASNIVNASGASLSNVRTETINKLIMCLECGNAVLADRDDMACPHCGSALIY